MVTPNPNWWWCTYTVPALGRVPIQRLMPERPEYLRTGQNSGKAPASSSPVSLSAV